MSAAASNEAPVGWGTILVELRLNGARYEAAAGAICAECWDHYGSVSVDNLEKYGVVSEISQVCLSFWHRNFPEHGGGWWEIPARRIDG